jgi:hypothetical protein
MECRARETRVQIKLDLVAVGGNSVFDNSCFPCHSRGSPVQQHAASSDRRSRCWPIVTSHRLPLPGRTKTAMASTSN